MRTPYHTLRPVRLTAALALAVTVVMAGSTVRAGAPLADYTGYTRIGNPPTAADGKTPTVPLAALKDTLPVGVTIYYTVLDRKAEGTDRGLVGDSFGVGQSNFDSMFVNGRESDLGKLDTSARFLYLYQVVNDSGRESVVKSASVRLLIDPRLITSWGHFAGTRGKVGDVGKVGKVGEAAAVVGGRQGVGFSMSFTDGKAARLIRPLSSDFPGVGDKRYLDPAPPVKAPQTYGFLPILLGERPAATGDDTGREPAFVSIVNNVEFPKVHESIYLKPAVTSDTEALPTLDDAAARNRMRDRIRKRWPVVRAVFEEPQVLKPRERSTIFGFTSEYGPTMDAAAITGRVLGVGFGIGAAEYLGKDGYSLVRDKDGRAELDKDGNAQLKDKDGKVVPAVGELGKNFERTKDGKVILDEKGNPRVKGRDGKVGFAADERVVPAAGAGAGAVGAAAGLIPYVSGVVPTPIAGVKEAADEKIRESGDATSTPAAAGGAGGGLGTGVPFLGGAAPAGGGGVAGVSPPSSFLPGRSSIPFGGGGQGGGSGNGNGTGDGNTGTDTDTSSGQGQSIVNNINIRVEQKQQQQQQQQQQQNQNQNQNQNNGGGPHGNVVPAPPAWLLGLLGLPAFAFFARRKKPAPQSEADETPTV